MKLNYKPGDLLTNKNGDFFLLVLHFKEDYSKPAWYTACFDGINEVEYLYYTEKVLSRHYTKFMGLGQ